MVDGGVTPWTSSFEVCWSANAKNLLIDKVFLSNPKCLCCDWQIPNLTRLWEFGHANQSRGKFSKHQLLTLCDCAVQKVCRRFKSDQLARCFSGVQAALTSMVAVSAHRINRGKSLKSCFLGELRCHWRLHECDINPAALKIISAGIRAGQSSQPGAEEETGATSGLSRRSCTHVVQSRLGERMPASIKKKKNPTAPVFFSLELLQCAFLGLQICRALRGDGSRRVGITVRHVWVQRCDPTIKTNPPPRFDESPVFIRLNIYRKQSPMQIDDEKIGGMVGLNNKIKILSAELKWSFLR